VINLLITIYTFPKIFKNLHQIQVKLMMF